MYPYNLSHDEKTVEVEAHQEKNENIISASPFAGPGNFPGGHESFPHHGGHESFPQPGGPGFFPRPGGPEPHTRPGGHERPFRPGHQNPVGTPPEFIPRKDFFKADPFSIKNCIGNFTYIWLKNGRDFWFYPSFVGRRTVTGYRWTRFGWTYLSLDLAQIASFSCIR